MTEDKKQRIAELRRKLASLTDTEKQALTSRGIIATIEGRQLSLHNTWLVYLQCNGNTPSVVGGYQQWKKAGKQVKRGEHGYMIWFPIGTKNEDGDILAAERFFTGTVFDISQIENIGKESAEVKPIITASAKPKVEPVEDNIMKGWSLV